jgi:hypothetical protein
MKVSVPVLVKDPEVAEWKGVPLAEIFTITMEDRFLDGPVTRRVAVLDFDGKTGNLRHGARFLPPKPKRKIGRFDVPKGNNLNDLDDPCFMQAAVFGGVYKTIAMFEEPDTLGRPITWAFPGSQLLVVPRAGDWPNAFYERDSRSLQFFYFTPPGRDKPVFTAHSQDIIAHETAHAIIDGVAPDLYHAQHPEGLAIHEAVADLTTLLMAFRSRKLASAVLEQTGGSIKHSSAFTMVAEQFGSALRENRHALRDLRNQRKMSDPDLDKTEPHALSEVLSGALYAVVYRIHEELKGVSDEEDARESSLAVHSEFQQWKQSDDPAAEKARSGDRANTSPGRALWIASERFKRTLLRGLDYLPPGEVGFADLARAILASDEASHPDSGAQREWIVDEFVRRGIVETREDLDVDTNYKHQAVRDLDLQEIMDSDWHAYRFAEKWRDLIGIPRRVPFEVRPRLKITKTYYYRDAERAQVTECLFKVCWVETEACRVGGGIPPQRHILRGSTLAIDWDKGIVRAVVRGREGTPHQRDDLVRRLMEHGQLSLGKDALAPDGVPFRTIVRGDIEDDGALRLSATTRMLHIMEGR